MNRMMKMLSGLTLTALCAGCASVPVTIDNRVPANINRENAQVVTGTAAGFQLLLFFPLNVNSRQARAWKQLQEKAGDAYITDVEIQESWKYGFVGTLYRTTFRAKAYPKTETAAP